MTPTRKRDHQHKEQKKSGKPKDRKAFLDQKHLVRRKRRKAHSEYLENLFWAPQHTQCRRYRE